MTRSSPTGIPTWLWVSGCLILLIACGGLVVLGIGAFFITYRESGEPTAEGRVQEEAGQTELNQGSEIGDDGAPQAGDPALLPFGAERQEIESDVIAIRGLEPRRPVTVTFLTKDELRSELEADFLENYPPDEARDDAIVLSAFDFIEADFDLHGLVLDLLVEQIAGYYDAETDEFVIVGEGEFGVMEQLTHAHEFVHALQDQHYDFDSLEDKAQDDDASLALTALIEGDATLVEILYLASGAVDGQELLDLLDEVLTIDTSVLDSAPPFLASELEFPYTAGLEFTQALFEEGGYSAVEAAWDVRPQSTEQILHPERFQAGDRPQVVSLRPLTETLGSGWRLIDDNVLGEFYLREYLIQQLDEASVELAATGWGGDRYAVYWNETDEEVVLTLRLAWDTNADRLEFTEVFAAYPAGLLGNQGESSAHGSECWTGGWVICLLDLEGDTLVVRAPDPITADRIIAAQLP